ncbi:MAG: glycosyltransferase [Clostridia bacterium]
MKILQINTVYKNGSTGRMVYQLREKQLSEGMDAYVLYGKGKPSTDPNVYRINNPLGFYLHKYMSHAFGYEAFYSIYQTKKAIKLINDIKPDLIHLHNLHEYYINIKILIKYINSKNIPVVWTFHDCWPFTGHCAHFSSVNCMKWQHECHHCPLIHEYPRSISDVSRKAYHKKKELFCSLNKLRVVTVSHWLEGLVRQSFFMNKSIMTICNYVDTNKFFPAVTREETKKKYAIEHKFVVLGVASGWSKKKGFSDFVALSKYLQEDEVIFIVGTAPIKQLPSNMINIQATTDLTELVQIYQMADVFFNPSRQETFGLTTIEAMACGTPAIVYNTTACPEVIGYDDNQNAPGCCVGLQDIDSVYQSIKSIRGDSNRYRENARNRVMSEFQMSKQITKYIDTYRELLNEES